MLDMEATKNFSIDKSDWKKVKFGDVVFEPKESVKDPVSEGIEHVVGLEHIDSEDMQLRRSASMEESTTFTKKFSKGDVLFGRRRAYLKKAAKAGFEGICSGDITVMRAKEELLLPELLPFIVNNDKFFDYAITHSAGGLSPRVKFKDLAQYEFSIPNIENQEAILDILKSIDELKEKEKIALANFLLVEQVNEKNIFLVDTVENSIESKIGRIKENWRCMTLQELLDENYITSHLDGNHGSYYPRNDEFVAAGVPYISANCIDDDFIRFDNAKYLSEERANQITKGIAINGDILFAHNATVGPVCFLETELEKVILSTSLTYYRVNTDKLDSEYLFYFMKSRLFQSQVERVMSQSTRNQVPITTQRKLYFLIPPDVQQKSLVKELKKIKKVRKGFANKGCLTQKLYKELVKKVF